MSHHEPGRTKCCQVGSQLLGVSDTYQMMYWEYRELINDSL